VGILNVPLNGVISLHHSANAWVLEGFRPWLQLVCFSNPLCSSISNEVWGVEPGHTEYWHDFVFSLQYFGVTELQGKGSGFRVVRDVNKIECQVDFYLGFFSRYSR